MRLWPLYDPLPDAIGLVHDSLLGRAGTLPPHSPPLCGYGISLSESLAPHFNGLSEFFLLTALIDTDHRTVCCYRPDIGCVLYSEITKRHQILYFIFTWPSI